MSSAFHRLLPRPESSPCNPASFEKALTAADYPAGREDSTECVIAGTGFLQYKHSKSVTANASPCPGFRAPVKYLSSHRPWFWGILSLGSPISLLPSHKSPGNALCAYRSIQNVYPGADSVLGENDSFGRYALEEPEHPAGG